jgi:predicted DNA-binding transcriptional regulator AlpA
MSIRTPELMDTLIDGISDGITLRQLCRIHPISKSEVYRWLKEDAEFAGRFARARELGGDAIAEEIIDIADDGSNDWIKREQDNGMIVEVPNHEHIQRSKLRVDARLKLLAKWFPQKYGEKTLIGSDPDNPLPAGFNVTLRKPGDGKPVG